MEINANLASKAYSDALTSLKPQKPVEAETTGGGPDFSAMAQDFLKTLQTGEAAVQDGLAGKADAHSVVEALATTELAIETAVTVRDKVVEAYQEILRMPV